MLHEDHIVSNGRCSSKYNLGLFATVPAPGFVFLSAKALGTQEDLTSWQEHAHAGLTEVLANSVPSLRSGLEKQYKVQQKLFADPRQSQAEYVPRLSLNWSMLDTAMY